MKRYSPNLLKKAARLYGAGYGYKQVAKMLSLPASTSREWSMAFKAMGEDGLLADGRASYPPATKRRAVEDYLAGKHIIDIMRRYGIRNRKQVKDWVKAAESGKAKWWAERP